MKNFTRIFYFLLAFSGISLSSYAQTADFVPSKVSGCDPLIVSFTNKSTGTITSYLWDFGDSKTSTLPNPTTSYGGAGTYTVKLTVRNGSGAPSTKTATITVYPSPTVSFRASPATACPCTEIVFNNTSVANAPGSYTSIWSFGDGYTSTENNPTHVYCTPGSYNVALKVTNSSGCEGTILEMAKVTIFDKPSAAFYASKTKLCKLPDTTVFTNMVTKGKAPYTFSWNFGDGTALSTAASPTHVYNVSGTYTVTLVVMDANGCKDTMTKVNYIAVAPMNSSFSMPGSICAGVGLVRFENTSVPAPVVTKWSWSDGGGTTGYTAQRDFWKGGTYTITMIDSFGPGCKDTAVNTYTVHPKPKPNFSYWPIYPCPAPVDIHFTNKSNDADSFLWLFGDGTTSKLKDPVHTYTHDSVFTVYMIAKTAKGCLDTFRVRDTTKPFPGGYPKAFYDSSNSPIIIRVFDATMSIVAASDSDCIPKTVKFGAGLFTKTRLPSVVDTAKPVPACGPITGYNLPYWYCSDVAGFDDPYPDEFYDSKINPGILGSGYPYPIRTYYWEFGDGTTSTSPTPSHIYTAEGVYTVRCTVTTDSCTFTKTMIVEAGEKPHAEFTMEPDTICKGDFVYFTNLSFRGLKYFWDFGDGFTESDTGKKLMHRYRVSGNRSVLLTATRYGCYDTMSLLLTINPPSGSFGVKYSCDTPFKIRILDSSYRATTTLWDFGDGATSSDRNPVHIYKDTGTYTITLITKNDTFSCVDTATRIIKLYKPNPTFTAHKQNVCLGDTVFIDLDQGNYITKYSWINAAPVLYSTKHNRFFTVYRDTGVYSIGIETESMYECKDTFMRKDYVVVSKPVVSIIASPVAACAPATILFTDASTNTQKVKNVSRTWYWGDATSKTDTGTNVNASKYYGTPGSYVVTLVTTDKFGCTDSSKITVESSRPVASFVAELDTYTCVHRPVKFFSTSSGSGLKYEWFFGDGGTSALQNPVYAYAGLGTFTVKLVVTDKTGCKDSITKTGFIKTVKPKASFTMSDSVALCPPLFVSFTNTSSADGIRFDWDFGNGSIATIRNPVAPFIDSGVYLVRLVAFDKYGCTDTAYKRTRVLGYDGALKYNPLSGCAPLTVSFEAELIQAEVMVWDFADGITKGAEGNLKTTHTYTEPGSYLPRLVLGDGKGCSTSSRGLDTIKVDGVVGVISHTPACINTEVIFNDSSYSYFSDYASSEWLFDDGFTSTDKNPRRTYSSEGTHIVKLITTNTNGCRDTVERTIRIYGLPTIKAMDTVICLNDQATLSAGGGVSYSWTPHATLSCTECNNPVTSTRVPVRYYVTGTDANGCQNRDTLDVGIKLKTTIVISRDTEVCARTPITLAASGAQQYLWTPETFLSNATIATPVATMDSTIVYRVIGSGGSCIPDTGFVRITIYPLPEVNAGPDQRVMAGTEVQLNGTGNHIKEYLWSPSASLSCSDCASPVARPEQTTTYMLKATSEHGCTATDDVIISIFCDQSQLFIPNTFTPNGDGRNDYFYPQGKGVSKIRSFIIFNRWGQKVYERQNIDANAQDQGWDGSFNGNALGPDTFVYTLEAACDNGEVVFWKGDVTLIK